MLFLADPLDCVFGLGLEPAADINRHCRVVIRMDSYRFAQ